MTTKVRALEARLIRAPSAVECLAILLELAQLHAATHRNREGLRCAREALNIARARGDSLGAARALAAASRCHYQRGDYVAAAAAGMEAMEAFDEKDLAGRAAALTHVATALLAVEALDIAEQLAERAASDAQRLGDPATEAAARVVWGTILERRRQPEAARRKFREAGAIQRRLGDTLMLKKSALEIGHGYRLQANEALREGEPDRARLLWRHAIRVYRVALATGASDFEDAIAWSAVAECECRLDEPQAALTVIREALEHAHRSANPAALARCHLWEGHALKALGKLDAARRACECARNAAEQLDHDPMLAECLRAEATLNDLAGRFESAHDLESRAQRVLLERAAFFSRMRDDVRAMLARHAQPGTAFCGSPPPQAAAC